MPQPLVLHREEKLETFTDEKWSRDEFFGIHSPGWDRSRKKLYTVYHRLTSYDVHRNLSLADAKACIKRLNTAFRGKVNFAETDRIKLADDFIKKCKEHYSVGVTFLLKCTDEEFSRTVKPH